MIIPGFGKVLRHNYQKVSTNRFVVDSPRFWRREFHPRFKDIFDNSDFEEVIDAAHSSVSYKFKTEIITLMTANLFNYFSGYRFIDIPSKNPQSPQQFLSDMYFVLRDILPNISFRDYPLIYDDFHLVYHEGNEGKRDSTKLGTDEHNNQNSLHRTELDILTEANHESNNTSTTENNDTEDWHNNFTVNDTFLSPQNQGVTPTITNRDPTGLEAILGKGVGGIPQVDEASFTTSTSKQNFGESNKGQSNTTSQGSEGRERLTQNNDDRTAHQIDTEMGMNQHTQNDTEKTSDYKESLDFDRGARLNDFYRLTSGREWKEILSRLDSWILHFNIATSEENYNGMPFYD